MAAKPPNLDSLLECPICLSDCDDPRVLTCLHTLCLKCLDQHIITSAEGSTFFCPSCRHKCEVPAGGVTSVPKNFFWNSLKEILKQTSWQEKCHRLSHLSARQVDCSNSGRGQTSCGNATSFCIECSKFYCSDCDTYHVKFEEFNSHQLVPVNADASVINAAVSRRATPRCDQHSTLPTDMYCDTCRVPVCLKCCVLKHKQHHYREIEEAAEDSRSLLSTLTKTAKNIASRLDKDMKELDKSGDALNTDCDEACRQVEGNAERIRAMVTQRGKFVVQEIRQAQITSRTQLKAAYKEAEINKAAVESLLSYIQALQVSDDIISQVVHAPGLQEQLRQHEQSPLQSVTLGVNLERMVQSMSFLKAMFGAVSVYQTTTTSGSLGGAVLGKMKVPLGPALLDLKPDFLEPITGLAMIGDCVCAVPLKGPYLWIQNIKTNTYTTHTIVGLSAVGMAHVRKDDTLVITDADRRLHLVKINQKMSIIDYVVKKLSFEPVDVREDLFTGKLIIANRKSNHIAICDDRGGMEYQVKVKSGIRNLRCALATRDGYMVLDWSSTGKLYWLSRAGDVVYTYRECLEFPYDAVQDSQGRVIIADQYQHQLHLVDANKDLSQYLLTDKDRVRYPRSVYLDEVHARLCVGYKDPFNGTPSVRLYKWPFV